MASPVATAPGAELRAILARFGKFQVSNWNQSDRDFKGSGVCMGMCLDWLRRIYSPSRLAKSKFGAAGRSAIYNPDEERWYSWTPKSQSRFEKQIKTHETYTNSANLNLQNMAEDVILPDLNARLLNDARAHFHKSAEELPSLSEADLVQALGSGQLAQAKLWKAQRIKEFVCAASRRENTPAHRQRTPRIPDAMGAGQPRKEVELRQNSI